MALFEQVTQKYLSTRVASSLAVEKTAEELKLLNLHANTQKAGTLLTPDDLKLVTKTLEAPAKIGANMGFPQYMASLFARWAEAGKLTRAVAGTSAQTLAQRPEMFYTKLMQESIQNATKATMVAFDKLTSQGLSSRTVEIIQPEIENQVRKAEYEVMYRILTETET